MGRRAFQPAGPIDRLLSVKDKDIETKKGKVFFGWWIVVAGFFIAVYIGGCIHFGFTAFFEPIADDFGWSYTQVSFAASLRGMEMGLLSPVVGLIMDRYGPRRLVFIGAALCGLGLLLLSQINSLAAFYGVFLLIALGISTCVGIVPMATVSNWFKKRVTLATGIIVSGVAAGGLLVPLATQLIDIFEWRTAVVILGFGAWAILLPLSLLFRHKPEQYGYSPDGGPSKKLLTGESLSPVRDNGLSVGIKQVLKGSTFWHITIGFMCHILVMNAVVTHVMPYLTDVGISRQLSSLMASAIPLTSIAGRLSFGWLGDRFNKKQVTVLGFVIAGLGLLSFGCVDAAKAWLLVPSLILIGLGYGGVVPMMSALPREYYGVTRLATILGFMFGASALGGMIGPPLAGLVFDNFGSYQIAWFGFAGLIAVGMISLATMPAVGSKVRI
jgi:MFS family permease